MRNDKYHHRLGYCCGMSGMQKESFNFNFNEFKGMRGKQSVGCVVESETIEGKVRLIL